MNTEASSSSPRPWFREPWVWLIIALPASAVFGGIITIWIAVESDDGLVQDDYYKYGMEINKTLDRDKAAVQYELVANLIISEFQRPRIIFRSGLRQMINLSVHQVLNSVFYIQR